MPEQAKLGATATDWRSKGAVGNAAEACPQEQGGARVRLVIADGTRALFTTAGGFRILTSRREAYALIHNFRRGVSAAMVIRARLFRAAWLAPLACAAAAATLQAQQHAFPTASPESSVAHQRVACHGASTVPLTFDAEQSLPLKLVANLSCGQEVAILSDLESYTVRVATAEGLSGYIARANLTAEPTSTPKAPQPSSSQDRLFPDFDQS